MRLCRCRLWLRCALLAFCVEMTKKEIVFSSCLILATLANVCVCFNSSVRDCEKILKESRRNFDIQYQLMAANVATNQILFLQIAHNYSDITNNFKSVAAIRATASQNSPMVQQEKVKEFSVSPLDYVFVRLQDDISAEIDGNYYRVGDWFGDGVIMEITESNIFLDSGAVYRRRRVGGVRSRATHAPIADIAASFKNG